MRRGCRDLGKRDSLYICARDERRTADRRRGGRAVQERGGARGAVAETDSPDADRYEELFGAPLPPVAYSWAGSFAETADGLPYIGAVKGMNPRLQFALCYGGNGITFGVHAGEMIRAGIEGRAHELDDVFGFNRIPKKRTCQV